MALVHFYIDKNLYAYIDVIEDYNNGTIFKAILKSLKREETKYNNFLKIYEKSTVAYYTIKPTNMMNNRKTNLIRILTGHVYFICNSLRQVNIPFKLFDSREKLNIENMKIVDKLNDKITLKDYQYEAVEKAFNRRFCTIQLPTGTGKTEICASIIKTGKLINMNTILYLVPTIQLKKEAIERFEKYDIKNINTEAIIKNNYINIMTYQSFVNCNKNNKFNYIQRDLLNCIIVDEAHHCTTETKLGKYLQKYKKLQMLIGMSATFTKNIENKHIISDLDNKDMQAFGYLGKCAYSMTIEESIARGLVTKIEINVLYHEVKEKLDEEDMGNWHAIKNIVLKSEDRAKQVAEYIVNIINNYNTIALLIPETEWSQIYMSAIANILQNRSDIKIYELHGSNKKFEYINNERTQIKKLQLKDEIMNNINNAKIKTIFSATSFFYEGCNISNLELLVNVYGGKGDKRVKQQAGRAMRLFKDKKVAKIVEIIDVPNVVLMSQFKTRMNIYKNEYNAEIIYKNTKLK